MCHVAGLTFIHQITFEMYRNLKDFSSTSLVLYTETANCCLPLYINETERGCILKMHMLINSFQVVSSDLTKIYSNVLVLCSNAYLAYIEVFLKSRLFLTRWVTEQIQLSPRHYPFKDLHEMIRLGVVTDVGHCFPMRHHQPINSPVTSILGVNGFPPLTHELATWGYQMLVVRNCCCVLLSAGSRYNKIPAALHFCALATLKLKAGIRGPLKLQYTNDRKVHLSLFR